MTVGSTVGYSTAVSKLRRPFLSDRYFFITVRLLQRSTKLTEPDFFLLARALNRARILHPVYLTGRVFLPDQWHVILTAELTLVIAVETESPRNSVRLNPETHHVG